MLSYAFQKWRVTWSNSSSLEVEVITVLLGLDFTQSFLLYWKVSPLAGPLEALSLTRFARSSDELERIEYLMEIWG